MSDADRAAARVEAFLPELADVPDESRAARLGAKQLADDVRLVFDDRELLRAEVARLKAELDEVTDLDRSALETQELRDERSRAVAGWHDQKKRGDLAEDGLRRLRAAIATELPPMTFVKERLATHPYGGEQNYLELAEAIWRAVGDWIEDPGDKEDES